MLLFTQIIQFEIFYVTILHIDEAELDYTANK